MSDGFSSYVIFLYADGLIQWTTGDASGGSGGLGGTEAQVGFNAGNGENFASHNYSQTPDVINIATSSRPEGLVLPGVLIYRVDGTVIAECSDSNDGEWCTNACVCVHACVRTVFPCLDPAYTNFSADLQLHSCKSVEKLVYTCTHTDAFVQHCSMQCLLLLS